METTPSSDPMYPSEPAGLQGSTTGGGTGGVSELVRNVLELYAEMDHRIARYQQSTSLFCLEGCGQCCATHTVESTPLECLPLAYEIYEKGEEGALWDSLMAAEESGQTVCVFYEPHPFLENHGRCGRYERRPLLCRLFAFSTRRNRRGQEEPVFCGLLKEGATGVVLEAQQEVALRMELPLLQDAFSRVATLETGMGYRLMPVNRAIREALEYLYWKRPGGEGVNVRAS